VITLDGLHEGPRHRFHGIGGKHLGLALLADEAKRPFQDLQPTHDYVQIHPVDGFHFRNDVLSRHSSHGLW
jgi:hypothetical protein